MKNNRKYFLSIVVALTTIYSCKKETATYTSDAISDYVNLQTGKYITYRLDSLLFINYGTMDTVISYQAKDVIDSPFTDNLGRPSWRVIRYLSDTAASKAWVPALTYMITPTRETMEVMENNLRYIKLTLPITNGFSWQGNSYIDTRPINPDLVYLAGWNYTYDSVGDSYSVLAGTIPNTLIVQQMNETDLGGSDTLFSSVNFSQEVYAKGIGMIYKNTVNWIYQPPNIGTPVGSTTGFGIRMSMIDHN